MGRGRKGDCKRDSRKRVRSKEGSDDSDEDYVVENEVEESDDDSEDLGNSFDEFEIEEESFASLVDAAEEDGEEEERPRKVVRSRKNKRSLKKQKIRARIARKRKRVSSEDEDEDYVGDDDDVDDDEEDYQGEDEEFTPEEDDDYVDEDEELTVRKKNNSAKVQRGERKLQKKRGFRRGRKSIKSKILKKPLANKRSNNRRLKKKEKSDYDDEENQDFIENGPILREKSKKTSGVRRRKFAVYSDSDFASSASSDFDYTISEEERDHVVEARELLGDLKTGLRVSSFEKKILEDGDFCRQRRPMHRKGKEKVKEVVVPEVVKPVCGICLSEEDKRRVRGTLNCCTHYFCFTCIMEWSKVESRCPLCKQRFRTITKNGRSMPGTDPRNVVIQVPKRDQVYQPSEEEIRSFIDPYENVMCTVCHEGGDDGLMLLCDLCDSPAHTYCVGLGRQVPDGNWYCDDCKPVAYGSSSSPAQNSLPDQRTSSNNVISRPSPIRLVENLDPISECSPRVTFAQGLGNLSSPRFPTVDIQVASPVYGSGAPTLSNRREIHRRIQSIISITRLNQMAGRSDGFSAFNLRSDLPNSQIDQVRETSVQSSRIQEVGATQHTLFEDTLQANHLFPSSSVQNRESASLIPSQLSRQVTQAPAIAIADQSINLTLWPQLGGINSITGYEQLCSNRRLSTGSAGNLSPHRVREESCFYMEIEQLKSMVQSHLKSLSHDIELGYVTFNDIEKSSTHTILAAFGHEPWQNNDFTVQRPLSCTHIDRVPVAVGQKSIMEDLCFSCFDSFVRDVVERILDTRRSPWLRLGL